MDKKTAIVPRSETFIEMDRLDQQQIVLAATGAIIDELIYKVKGQWGLSWAGINHIAFWMGDIKTERGVSWERIQMFGDRIYWSATVRAVNDKYNLASLGTAEAPELMEIYTKDSKGNKIPDGQGGFEKYLDPDPFCRRKALSMAQRNAKRAVTPEAVLKKWLQYFVDQKEGKKVDPPFSPKTVDVEYKVTTDKPKRKRRKKEPEPQEEPLVDQDEERIKTTLAANAIPMDDFAIYKYGNAVRIVPKPDFPQENFEAYNGAITDLLNGKWVAKENWWEVPC